MKWKNQLSCHSVIKVMLMSGLFQWDWSFKQPWLGDEQGRLVGNQQLSLNPVLGGR